MELQRRRKLIFLGILLAGFLTGSILPELLYMGSGTYAGFFSLYSLHKFEGMAVDAGELFPYILNVRLKTLLFLWMSSFTAAGFLFHGIYAWWLAAAAGVLLSLFTLRDGQEGLLLFFCCLFPQWILYAAMWKREFMFLVRGTKEGENRSFFYRKELAGLGIMCGYCILGSLAEAFLGIWTMKIFLRIC